MDSLPFELLWQIFLFLDARAFSCAPHVCRQWLYIVLRYEHHYWRRKCESLNWSVPLDDLRAICCCYSFRTLYARLSIWAELPLPRPQGTHFFARYLPLPRLHQHLQVYDIPEPQNTIDNAHTISMQFICALWRSLAHVFFNGVRSAARTDSPCLTFRNDSDMLVQFDFSVEPSPSPPPPPRRRRSSASSSSSASMPSPRDLSNIDDSKAIAHPCQRFGHLNLRISSQYLDTSSLPDTTIVHTFSLALSAQSCIESDDKRRLLSELGDCTPCHCHADTDGIGTDNRLFRVLHLCINSLMLTTTTPNCIMQYPLTLNASNLKQGPRRTARRQWYYDASRNEAALDLRRELDCRVSAASSRIAAHLQVEEHGFDHQLIQRTMCNKEPSDSPAPRPRQRTTPKHPNNRNERAMPRSNIVAIERMLRRQLYRHHIVPYMQSCSPPWLESYDFQTLPIEPLRYASWHLGHTESQVLAALLS